MPFDSAVYLVDCFFYDGAKVMFQLALTILQANKNALLSCNDEGDSIAILAKYLELIENPDRKIEVCVRFVFFVGVFSQINFWFIYIKKNEKNAIANIKDLLRDSYVNFGTITDEDIDKLRLKHRLRVVQVNYKRINYRDRDGNSENIKLF